MILAMSNWLLVLGFFGAGLFNMIGTASTRADFVRWGYPSWWCRVAGALEMAIAFLIALPAGRMAGLVLGAAIVVAAAATVIRRRELSHLIPLGVFVALIGISAKS